MKDENILILRILLAVSCVVCAAAFIIQTTDIYREAAEQMYTAEIIAEHFDAIAWAPVVMLTLIVVGAFLPYPVRQSLVSEEYRMEAMLKKVDVTDERLAAPLKQLRNNRIISIAIAAVCCAAMLIIGTQKTILVSMDLEYAVGQALPLLLIPTVVLFAGEFFISFRNKKVALEIMGIARGMEKLPPKTESSSPEKSLKTIRIVLYAAAVALVVAGIVNGGMEGVLVKATVICTECIGLG